MPARAPFSRDTLALDAGPAVDRICAAIRAQVHGELRRKGIVLGLSGGIDSSVVAALSARAIGSERVCALLMPERESSPESATLGQQVADRLGIGTVTEDIGATLDAAGCYRRRDEAIRSVIPEYGPGWKCKVVMPGSSGQAAFRIFSVVAQAPDGRQVTARLTAQAYLGIVAATNFKQRVRKMLEYYHADRLNYAVAGTPNRLEYDQGFFVKNGDGSADVKPIAHLYKSQVSAMARFMKLPDEICNATPTTDTYSLQQGQDEFYFGLPYQQMDLALWAYEHEVEAAELGKALGVSSEAALAVYADIEAKRRATRYLGGAPILMGEPISAA
jgi:NAD+ synthase